MPRKPIKFGRKAPITPTRECDTCGGPMKANSEGVSVCLSCSGREKQKRRLPEKSESVDREQTDDERDEYRDAWSAMREEWGAE
jgi:hypothetical protein